MTDTPSLLSAEQARVARILLAEQATKLVTLNDAAQRAYRDRLPPNIEFEANQRTVQVEALTLILKNLAAITETVSPIDIARKIDDDDTAGVVTPAAIEKVTAPHRRVGKVKP